MRAIDKIDRLGEAGVRALLGAGRRDESGDFTAGAGLGEAQAEVILAFMGARAEDGAATCARLRDLVGGSAVGREGVEELETMAELLAARGASAVIDPSVVRGLGYYTGPVVEAELTFEVVDEDGRPRQFGSVAGGGRYDGLVRRFTGEAVPATGISIGVDRLLAALGEKGRLTSEEAGPVVVTVMDRAEMAGYQAMAAELRAAGLRAEVFLGGGNMARQLKYADQRGAAVAVIEGGDERARGVVQIKDLALGARLAAEIATHEDWKAQPAQVEVPRAGLVEAVRAMLARGGGWAMVADRAFLPVRAWGRALARLDRELARILGGPALDGGDDGGAGGAAAGGRAARPLRRGHPGAGLRHPRRGGGDDAPPRLHRADRAAAHGRGRGAGALCLFRPGVAAAGRGLDPAAGVPAGGVRGVRGRRSGGA